MLSCDYDFADEMCDYYAEPEKDFSVFPEGAENCRCQSCRKKLVSGDIVLKHRCWRPPTDEELCEAYDNPDGNQIFNENEQVELPDEYLCEKCGEIRMNLESIGYRCVLGDDLREDMAQYQDMTGFDASRYASA